MQGMKKYFFAGCIICLPLIITLFIIDAFIDYLTKPFTGLVNFLLTNTALGTKLGSWTVLFVTQEQALRYITQFLILVFLFVVITLLGVIARVFIFKYFIHTSEKLVQKIPLINKIYEGSKEFLKSILGKEGSSLKQVVLVPFPKNDSFIIGFVANEAPCGGVDEPEKYMSIFVPTTPNPTSGFLLIYKKTDVQYLDMTREEAFKYIVSCGVIVPKGMQ